MSHSVVGKSLPRTDALLQVTGRSQYSDDFTRPGMLFGKTLRSQHAHARIVQIDTSAAERLPGVKSVITAKDVPYNRHGLTHQDQPILADEKVRYFGDPVAAVAATSWEAAENALALIRVEYDPLPGVFDPVEAMKPGAPLVNGESNIAFHQRIRFDDIEQGWKESDVIFEEKITTPVVEHAQIEPHAAIAEVSLAGELLVMTSTQRPFALASDLSKALKLPMNKLRVAPPAVGAGFGGKSELTIEPYAAIMAMKTGKPVKMVYTREDEFNASTVRHSYITRYKSGLKKDGTLVARQVEIISDCGPYVSFGQSTLGKACVHAAGPYRIKYVTIEGYLVYTNNPVGGAMRGFGVTQLGFAYEVHMDTIAAEMGLDPVEFRLKNLFVDNCSLPTGQVVPLVTLTECMKKAVELAGWKKEVNIP
ncbi:MAG: molybdopterin cofactor-binding domain-containing protein [Candidatus Korobacteraceae bacterium]